MIELSANQMTFKCYIFGKMTGLVGVAKCDFVSELTRPKYTNTGRLQIPTRARAKHVGSRVFFSARVALSLDGERAEPLANMLFGARQWTASSSVAAHQRCRVVKYCVAAELEDCAHD